MTKQAFLDELNRLTAGLTEQERTRLTEYYSEMIDDRVEEGVPEEEAVAAMGSPADIAGAFPSERPAAPSASSEEVAALRHLRVRVFNADVTVVREPLSGGAAAQLRFSDPTRFTWRMEGDTLAVEEPEPEGGHRGLRWLMQVIGLHDVEVTVALADALPGDLTFNSKGGDLRVENVALGSADLHTASGDIKLASVACGAAFQMSGGTPRLVDVQPAELRVHTASGDVEARDVRVNGPARLESASGDIELRSFDCDGLTLTTASGDIEIDRGACGATSLRTASGDVRMDEVETDPQLTVQTASGDVELNRCIARDTRVTTASGDVEMLLEPLPCGYDIGVNSVSGDIHFDDGCAGPSDDLQPTIAVKTVSGDIEARVAR